DIYNAQCVAETIRKAVSGIVIDGLPRQHCSFGIAQWNNSETLDRLLERADKALYLAKEKGRNRVELGLLN
uniref:diguanylate cyclase domain-containing protein n=1 Tax=Neptunomonas sp. TaxID=1971898 RepID=UPI00356AC5DB